MPNAYMCQSARLNLVRHATDAPATTPSERCVPTCARAEDTAARLVAVLRGARHRRSGGQGGGGVGRPGQTICIGRPSASSGGSAGRVGQPWRRACRAESASTMASRVSVGSQRPSGASGPPCARTRRRRWRCAAPLRRAVPPNRRTGSRRASAGASRWRGEADLGVGLPVPGRRVGVTAEPGVDAGDAGTDPPCLHAEAPAGSPPVLRPRRRRGPERAGAERTPLRRGPRRARACRSRVRVGSRGRAARSGCPPERATCTVFRVTASASPRPEPGGSGTDRLGRRQTLSGSGLPLYNIPALSLRSARRSLRGAARAPLPRATRSLSPRGAGLGDRPPRALARPGVAADVVPYGRPPARASSSAKARPTPSRSGIV